MNDYIAVRQLGIVLTLILFGGIVVAGVSYEWSRWEAIAAMSVLCAGMLWWDRKVCRPTR